MKKSDKDVVDSVLSGDIDAFGVLVRRYDAMLRRYIRRLGVTPPRDEDVLQDIFLKNVHQSERLQRTLRIFFVDIPDSAQRNDKLP